MNQTAETTVVAPISTAAPVTDARPADLWLLGRWLLAMSIVTVALGACLWTRMTVRQTALELDSARSAVARAEIDRERLLVERALLRDPGRLADSAAALSLVAPVATEHLVAVGEEPSR